MRAIETATNDELVRAMRAARALTYLEIDCSCGIIQAAAVDVDRCLDIVVNYEESSGVAQTELSSWLLALKKAGSVDASG